MPTSSGPVLTCNGNNECRHRHTLNWDSIGSLASVEGINVPRGRRERGNSGGAVAILDPICEGFEPGPGLQPIALPLIYEPTG